MDQKCTDDRQQRRDELSKKLERAVDVVGDLLKVYRVHGERGPAAVFVHTEQLDDDQLRHALTALIAYLSINNQAVAAMFTNPGGTSPTLH